MNERIKEFAEQASKTSTSYFDGRGNVTETYFDKEKFAELIVRECANVVENCMLEYEGTTFQLGKTLLEHFGVKE